MSNQRNGCRLFDKVSHCTCDSNAPWHYGRRHESDTTAPEETPDQCLSWIIEPTYLYLLLISTCSLLVMSVRDYAWTPLGCFLLRLVLSLAGLLRVSGDQLGCLPGFCLTCVDAFVRSADQLFRGKGLVQKSLPLPCRRDCTDVTCNSVASKAVPA